MSKHKYIQHDKTCDRPNCEVCEGGIKICLVCGGIEGTLTTECIGERLSSHMLDSVYEGAIDYKEGYWNHTPSIHCPAYYRTYKNS